MCSIRTLWQLQQLSIPNQYVIACISGRILHRILRRITMNSSWPIGEIRWVVLESIDDPRYVSFVSCRTRKVELLLVLTSQNDFDALDHVTCVISSRILLDHRFPTNVFLTSVDDVCPKLAPNQIYHCPARNFSFIMEIIHLLILIRCPNLENYSPCAQIPNWKQNFTLSLLGAFCEPFHFSTLNGPKWQFESYLKNSGCVCNEDLAAAAAEATYLEVATAELQNRFWRERR